MFTLHPHNPNNKNHSKLDGIRKIEFIDKKIFKDYLSIEGKEFSDDPEFLTFFALPYIENPHLHESYYYIFTLEWSSRLKHKLKTFLEEMVFFSDEDILLVKMYKFY